MPISEAEIERIVKLVVASEEEQLLSIPFYNYTDRRTADTITRELESLGFNIRDQRILNSGRDEWDLYIDCMFTKYPTDLRVRDRVIAIKENTRIQAQEKIPVIVNTIRDRLTDDPDCTSIMLLIGSDQEKQVYEQALTEIFRGKAGNWKYSSAYIQYEMEYRFTITDIKREEFLGIRADSSRKKELMTLLESKIGELITKSPRPTESAWILSFDVRQNAWLNSALRDYFSPNLYSIESVRAEWNSYELTVRISKQAYPAFAEEEKLYLKQHIEREAQLLQKESDTIVRRVIAEIKVAVEDSPRALQWEVLVTPLSRMQEKQFAETVLKKISFIYPELDITFTINGSFNMEGISFKAVRNTQPVAPDGVFSQAVRVGIAMAGLSVNGMFQPQGPEQKVMQEIPPTQFRKV